MVSKEHLDQLRAERRTPHATMEYIPDGSVTSAVNQNVETQRELKIADGEQTLKKARQEMLQDFKQSSREGLTKVKFNQSSGALNP